uniref:Oxoglutarate (alpha-ketoglutarate) receptor 1a, tandem duplicate 3 n=1 Tax=Neolamprologus brichardi TaxID=32507 RepID=A0A3Q4N7G3_NEOBR
MAVNHSTNSNCTDLDEVMKLYYLPVAYSLIFIVGLVGNVTLISIYLAKLRPWKSSSIILVNLAVTDLLYVLSLPFLVYYYSRWDKWPLCEFMCRVVRVGFHLNLYGSILFLTCLAVFRYVVVIKPLSAAQVQQKRWGIIACSAVWIISAAEITPMLTMISVNDNKKCIDFASTEPVTTVRAQCINDSVVKTFVYSFSFSDWKSPEHIYLTYNGFLCLKPQKYLLCSYGPWKRVCISKLFCL